MVSVRAIEALDRVYSGAPVPLRELSTVSGLSVSYLEQIFSKLLAHGIVTSKKGPGGGYCLREGDISVSDIIRAVSSHPEMGIFKAILSALDDIPVSQNTRQQAPQE